MFLAFGGLSLRLLVEERIANIGIPLDIFAVSMISCGLKFFGFLGFFANQPTVHSGGVSRGRGCGTWRN